jgi:hypothetical protein
VTSDYNVAVDPFHEPFTSFAHEAFRLEALPHYRVLGEAGMVEEYLSGNVPCLVRDHADWLSVVRALTSNDRRIRRVRVIDDPRTEYQTFQLGWVYLHNVEAGEDIRTIRRDVIRESLTAPSDFWLFDREWGLRLDYDYLGRFLEAAELTPFEVDRGREVREMCLTRSSAFEPTTSGQS